MGPGKRPFKISYQCTRSSKWRGCVFPQCAWKIAGHMKLIKRSREVRKRSRKAWSSIFPRCPTDILASPGVNQRYSTDLNNTPEHTVLVKLLSSNRSLVTYHPLFYPSRFGKIRHERIAMLFRRGIRASALLERYKMGRVTSCARSSHTLERACKKK